jgi:8-oxo-dGTP pyrophosphatase MutT (NUDIX family)
MSSYEESYLGQLRKMIGEDARVIITAARAVVRDEAGRVLFIQRNDNQMWAMPAGCQELDESILDCVKREVWEETGLTAHAVTPIAIYSNLSIVTAYGQPYHLFLTMFTVDKWSGTLVTRTDETLDARFFDLDDLPDDIPDFYREAIEDVQQYDGTLIIK